MNPIALQPEHQDWTIGGKQFAQEPFGLDRTTKLLGIVARAFEKLSSKGELGKITNIDSSSPEAAGSIFNVVAQEAPELVSDFLCLCLDITDKAQKEFVFAKCKPTQAMGIVKTFIEQNDVKEIVDSFLELRTTFQKTMLTMQESPKSEESTGSDKS